jgi:hypothetical protein
MTQTPNIEQLRLILKQKTEATMEMMRLYDSTLSFLIESQVEFFRVQQELRLCDVAELKALLDLQRAELKEVVQESK